MLGYIQFKDQLNIICDFTCCTSSSNIPHHVRASWYQTTNILLIITNSKKLWNYYRADSGILEDKIRWMSLRKIKEAFLRCFGNLIPQTELWLRRAISFSNLFLQICFINISIHLLYFYFSNLPFTHCIQWHGANRKHNILWQFLELTLLKELKNDNML